MTDDIHGNERKNDHKADEDQVFRPDQYPMTGKILSFGNPFFKGSRDRDPVEQILYQTERTEPSADEATENRAEQHQKSDDIKGKPIVPAGEDCLQGADRTGAEGAGAGVAVQSGDAKCLRGSGIDPSGGEAVQISVCDCQEEQLNDQPRTFDDFLKKVCFHRYILLSVFCFSRGMRVSEQREKRVSPCPLTLTNADTFQTDVDGFDQHGGGFVSQNTCSDKKYGEEQKKDSRFVRPICFHCYSPALLFSCTVRSISSMIFAHAS